MSVHNTITNPAQDTQRSLDNHPVDCEQVETHLNQQVSATNEFVFSEVKIS